MKTVHRKDSEKEPEKRKNSFWEFMGGEFLLKKSVIRWYPYILLLFILATIVILNEKRIADKNREINELSKKHQETILNLKETKRIFPYDADAELLEQLEEDGFIKDDKSLYKIIIHENDVINQ